jgi:dihydroorotate dehydrogenase
LIKKILFKLEPEIAHTIALGYLKFMHFSPLCRIIWKKNHVVKSARLEQNIFGATFPNPVGIGAGFDKNGEIVPEMFLSGFGFTEIGTVTPKQQEGNFKPRLYRHIQEKSLQNAMGFNNAGADKVLKNLRKDMSFTNPVGINIGKNKTTPENKALEDYLFLIKKFEQIATYLVINISSPNTPNLRDLQNEDFIKRVFSEGKKLTNKPILLKIAPDMSLENAVSLSRFAVENGADGIIATNTTTNLSLVKNPQDFGGGLSGEVLKEKSFEVFDAIAEEFFKKTVLISVGGIDSVEEVYRRLRAGASLVQIYTSLIYQGSGLVPKINKGLLKILHRDGFSTISDVIGVDR